MASPSKCIELPEQGRLLCSADLRGNLRDFSALVARFEAEPGACLLFLGNLIHGPYLLPGEWKPELGSFYRDESPTLLLKLSLLMEKHPGRVFALLGNHEYAHLGGPHTSKFADDETAALEARLGAEAAAYVARFLRTFPLWARSKSGLLFCHAAPGADLARIEDLESLDYGEPGEDEAPILASDEELVALEEREEKARLLGRLLWSGALPPEKARKVAQMAGVKAIVYGHDIVAGHECIGAQQIILGTSFCLRDEQKRYLSIDLSPATRYESVADLREGVELLPLYPPVVPPVDADLPA